MRSVVAYLQDLDSGEVRLVLDDVSSQSDSLDVWSRDRVFTHSDYSRADLAGLKLSKEQFAQIGENLVIRLLALRDELE